MKKVKIIILIVIFLLLVSAVFAAEINSSSYKQRVVVSAGGENVTSDSYKQNIVVGIINRVINSTSYINRLGFFHTLLLADGQPCTSASQCEGGFCCSNECSSSSCPTPSAAAAGGAGAPGGEGGVFIPKAEPVKDFSISPGSIKEEVVLGAAKTRTILIKNTGDTALSFDLSVLTVDDIFFLSDNSFTLDAGQEKTVEANIIGKKLGSYFGEMAAKADGIEKSVSIVIEIESEGALFDVKIDIPTAYKQVKAGSELKTQITLLNVGPPRKVDVTPTYIIKDKFGKIVYDASETFAVEKQTSYVKLFKIPQEAQPGDYIAIVELRYENLFAVSSELFKVLPKDVAVRAIKSNALWLFMIVGAGLMLMFIYLLIPKIRIFRKE